jgi:hypothetical protein
VLVVALQYNLYKITFRSWGLSSKLQCNSFCSDSTMAFSRQQNKWIQFSTCILWWLNGTPGALVALVSWMRRYWCSDGSFVEDRDGCRLPPVQLFLFTVWWGEPAWVSSFVHKLNFVASKAWNENLWAAEKEGDIYPTYISTSQFRLRQERHRLGWCLWHIWPMCHTFFLLRSHVGGNKECVCFFFAWGFFLGV